MVSVVLSITLLSSLNDIYTSNWVIFVKIYSHITIELGKNLFTLFQKNEDSYHWMSVFMCEWYHGHHSTETVGILQTKRNSSHNLLKNWYFRMNGKSIIILIESNMFLKEELNQFQNREIIHIFLLCSTTTADYWTSG